MKNQIVILLLAIISPSFAHDHDHNDQMPLDYVRFPYQALYPGDNDGKVYIYRLPPIRSTFLYQSLRTPFSLGSQRLQDFRGSSV